MRDRVTISVVTPIFGVEKYISRYAESLLGQAYENLQFVFVNDGTKDESFNILKALIEEKYSHLKDRIVLIDKENQGCPISRRIGLSYATGDYVMQSDPDDWYEPGAFEVIASVAEATRADVIYFDYYRGGRLKSENTYTVENKQDFIRDIYNHRASGAHWNKCMKRSLYFDNTIYFPVTPCAEDQCLVCQLLGYAQSIVHIDRPLYNYRRDNPHAVTKKNPKFRRFKAVDKFLNLYDFQQVNGGKDSAVSVIYDDIMMKAGWSSILYGFDFFKSRPYLADNICRISVRPDRDVPVLAQCLTKVYAYFLRSIK